MSKQTFTLQRHTHCAIAVAMCFSMVTGCAQDPSESTTAPASQSETEQKTADLIPGPENTASAPQANSDMVVGIWLGTAAFNEAKLKSKLNSLNVSRQDNAIAQAESFLSTMMAIEFRQDGTVENDLEMVAVNGQQLRDGSQGQWRMLESNDQSFVIETTETSSAGTTSTSQVTYLLGQDANEFSLSIPVTEDLQGCDARLVFKRQSLTAANLAQGETATQLR